MTNVFYNLTNILFFTTNDAFCYIKVGQKSKVQNKQKNCY